MLEDGVVCVKCGDYIHYKCAHLLCAFERKWEQIVDYVCLKHWKHGDIIHNKQNGYHYRIDKKTLRVTKFLHCEWEFIDIKRRTGAVVEAVTRTFDFIVSCWSLSNTDKRNQNRLHNAECGKPESGDKAIKLLYSDGLKNCDIGYYQENNLIRDADEDLQSYDIEEKKYKFVEWRFRNNHCAIGISCAYHSFDENVFKEIENCVIPLVQVDGEIFKKYRNDTSVFHISYAQEMNYGKIDILINRDKLYIKYGYKFGKLMKGTGKSQELIRSTLTDYKQVITCMELIYNTIKRTWSDFEPEKYDLVQVNNYLVESVEIEGTKIDKRLGIVNHNDNPVNMSTKKYTGEYHFDEPIYIIGIQGSGTISCGYHQHNTLFDSTQSFRILPGTILRMEGYAWWNTLHCVSNGSIDEGQRIILILRKKHPLCRK